MKKIFGFLAAAAMLTLAASAQTTLTAWTFDNLSTGANGAPSPSTGFGSASALGFNNSYNGTNSVSNPDIQSLAGSSTDPVGPNCWRVRGAGSPPSGGNGWSTNAPIGSQGAKFIASTFGYYKIKVSFDVYATPDAEANLLVQFTTEGTIWQNAPISSAGTLGTIGINTDTNISTALGSYVILTNNGITGWNNQIVADLTGISGADNNPNFAVRLVNASKGTNCVDTTGAVYNNTSGSWSFDNVVVQGVSFDTITAWTFEGQGTPGYAPHPAPAFGSGLATAMGFDNSYSYTDGGIGSTNKPDITANGAPFSSSGSAGQNVWRVRGSGGPTNISGGGVHNGWNTAAPIGTQGAQFDVSTLTYDDIIITFDMFSTSQGEAKMCVEYTTNAWTTTNIAYSMYYGANPSFMATNTPSAPGYSPDTVAGTYFWQNIGQAFYNNFVVDLTAVPDAANNANFSFRIVNAAQGNDCLTFNGGSYNNSSGNWRYDNVAVNGRFTGSNSPALSYDPNATVDAPFTNTFSDNPNWRSNITAIYVNGGLLTNSAYTTNTAGMIVYDPSKSVVLQSSGVKSIVIYATGYNNDKVTQPLLAGVANKLTLTTQPAAPSASGGTLTANPVLSITDKYGNGSTNPYANATVTAAVGGTGAWTLGGDTTQTSVNGFMTFTNLTATVNGSTNVPGAFLALTVNGYTNSSNSSTTTNLNSATFTIGAPPVPFTRGNLAVLQIDTVANNTTFSMIEIKPSASKQTAPVNIVPISATGPNALRLSSSGSTGRLSVSSDGTLINFVGFADGSSATPDETLIQARAVGTLNYTNLLALPLSYDSISFGGSQGRAAATVDNVNYLVADKGGLYINHQLWSEQNNVVVRTFGQTPWVETQKTANGSPIPAVYSLQMTGDGAGIVQANPNNLVTDPVAVDFYMISTNGGASYDILYVLDQTSASLGEIKKYSWVPDSSQISGYGWTNNGSFLTGTATNGTGGDSLFATTNGSGGVYLYYTTGGGGTAANSVVRLTDNGGFNNPINIISSNLIYTATAGTSIKGLTFVPQQTANQAELIPPPILTAQAVASVSSSFTITNTPDDPAWRGSITGITVNGAALPAAACNTNLAGKLVFDPSQSVLLQTSGAKTIGISATGYSSNSVVQILAVGPASQLVVTTQPKSPAADGGVLTNQPVVAIRDLYGNNVTNAANITAAAAQNTWTLGGTKTIAASSGVGTYAGLTAFSPNALAGATIGFTSGSLSVTSSPGFNIPAPILSLLTGTSVSGGKFIFGFTNATGLSFSVLATNNIAVPVASWPVIGPAIESPAGSGNYHFTNSPATNSARYFILRQP
jgi:hypothetical protein